MSNITIQTASLWASGDSSVFSGNGGPQAYDPFFGWFADVVGSDGLDGAPFNDQVWNVDAGDEVVFVVAVQNRAGAPAYNLSLKDIIPAGFGAPPEGTQLSVTDGVGNPLDFTGDLFGSTGLQLTGPIAGYDPSSGANVVLVTFSLSATNAVQAPGATLQNTAQVTSYSTTPGGPDVLASPVAAATTVTTSGIVVGSTADQTVTSLSSGKTASFDVTVTLPEGTTRDLRLDEILPQTGQSWFQLVSAQVVSTGANLQTASAPIVGGDGSIALGDVVNLPDNVDTNADQLVVRLTVAGAGTTAGMGILQTVVSALDPNNPGERWSSSVTNSLGLAAPNVAPTISGTRADQNATNTMRVRPFAALTLTDPDPGQTETLTIHLSDPLMGTLTGPASLTTTTNGDFVLTGTVDQVQADARSLLFATGPGRSGLELMTLTIDDGAGGTASDATTGVNVSAIAPEAASMQHSPIANTGTVLTATATGSTTVAQVEVYGGPVDYLQSQFIYDGTQPLAIVAQTANVFIKNVAGSTAVQLLSGQNVVDAGHGSNFLVSGTGSDVFFLDGRQQDATWDTIVGFHPGDIATLWGFKAGVSHFWWDDNAGAVGSTGSTLRADLSGSGQMEASITFAGTTSADTAHYAVTVGNVGGTDYLAVFAQ